MKPSLVFNQPNTYLKNGHFYIESRYQWEGKERRLWFCVDEENASLIDEQRMDGFLIAGLLMAMKRNAALKLKGMVSQRLYYHATHYFSRCYQGFPPNGSE